MSNIKGNNQSKSGLPMIPFLSSVSVVALLFAAAPAAAQSSGTNIEEDEIVVTARKIEESLQDIPVSIAAFTAADLEKRGIEDLTEIARATAGFSFEDFNGAFGAPTIRAQSQARLTNPVQNVSTFYNGVYLQRSYQIDQSLLNIGQVEVLRGPQSASLGRNGFAGAITYTSRRVGDEPEVSLDFGVGEDEFRSIKAEAAIPLVKDGGLGITLGFADSTYDGGWENNHPQADNPDALTRGNVGGYDNQSYSLGVNFSPTDKLTGSLNYLNSEQVQENPASFVIVNSTFDSPAGLLNCGADAPFGGASLFCGEVPVEPILPTENRDGSTPVRPEGLVIEPNSNQTIESEVASFSLDYELTDQISLSYLYGRTEASYTGGAPSNFDPTSGLTGFFGGLNAFSQTGNGEFESDSHEFRVNYSPTDSLSTYVGLYISDTEDRNINAGAPTAPPNLSDTLPAPVEFPDPRVAGVLSEGDVTSIFGFISYDVGPFSFSAEGRYTDEEIFESGDTVELSVFTPRLTAGYDINDSSSVYASYARGTKIGGLNPFPLVGFVPGPFVDPSQRFFDEETNDTFEIGSRNEFLNGDLTFNVTGFYIEGDNLQVSEAQVLAADDMTTIAPAVVGNLGGSETFGFEVEANWYLNDNLNLYGSYGFADAEFIDDLIDQQVAVLGLCDDVVCNANGDIGGNTLPRAPKSTLNLGFFWEDDFTDDFGYFIGGDVGYQSRQFGNTVNSFTISDRTIVDASIGLRKGNFEAKISANNLLDEEYVSNAFDINFGSSPFFGSRAVIPNLGDRRLVKFNLSYDY